MSAAAKEGILKQGIQLLSYLEVIISAGRNAEVQSHRVGLDDFNLKG